MSFKDLFKGMLFVGSVSAAILGWRLVVPSLVAVWLGLSCGSVAGFLMIYLFEKMDGVPLSVAPEDSSG